jgi:hypothetical protein
MANALAAILTPVDGNGRHVQSCEVPRPEVTAHLAAVSKLVAATGDKGFTEMPGYYLDVMGLYDRCRSMLDAVRTLLEA